MLVPDRENLARAAGFFNGEGSTFLVKPNRPSGGCYIHLSIRQAVDDEEDGPAEDLTHFQDTIGGIGKIHGPYRHEKHKTVYDFRTSSFEPVQAIVVMLWPWLSWVKQLQYLTAKESLEHYNANHPKRTGNYGRRWLSS